MAFAPQTSNNVVDGIASRIQGDMVTYIVTLIFPLSNFALFWSPRARTRAAVLAEGFEVVVRHLRQDELELRIVSRFFHEHNGGTKRISFLCKSKLQTTVISTAAALRT